MVTQNTSKRISAQGMEVSWEYTESEMVSFTLKAPLQGWVAIGFNEKQALSDTWLLMARVQNGKAEVIEHYVRAPGDYVPTATYGDTSGIVQVRGRETSEGTELSFTLPVNPTSPRQKSLEEGRAYHLLLAYSVDDDFAHHSRMRTSKQVTL